jgi:DNA-binding beta-propeller fold protein YncE
MKSPLKPLICVAFLLPACAFPANNAAVSNQRFGTPVEGVSRLLYVTDPAGLSIYDINDGHKLLRKLDVPNSGDYKGIAASPQLGKLYLTSYKQDDLICIDLGTDQIDWRKHLGSYADSMAITPDGMRLYLPFRNESYWKVVDAKTGDVTATIETEHGKNYDVHPIGNPVGPHNTWMNPAGTRAYLEVLTVPYVRIVDTATNRVIGKVGPFSKGIRPFTVSDDEKYLYANVDGLLGFEIGAVRDGSNWGGKMLYRVETKTPPERLAQIPNPPAHRPHSTPSHGINISHDQKEIWVADTTYGYVYVFNVESLPPKQIASIPLYQSPAERPHPGWISFGIDGRYAYPDGGAVIDAKTKKIVARIPTSEKLIEIDFRNGRPIAAGHR